MAQSLLRLSLRPGGRQPLYFLRQSRKNREPVTPPSAYLSAGPPLSPRPGAWRWGMFAGAGRTGVVGGCVGCGGGCGGCGGCGCCGGCGGCCCGCCCGGTGAGMPRSCDSSPRMRAFMLTRSACCCALICWSDLSDSTTCASSPWPSRVVRCRLSASKRFLIHLVG